MAKSASIRVSEKGGSISARLWKTGKRERLEVQTPRQFLSHMMQQITHNADANIVLSAKAGAGVSQEAVALECGKAMGKLFKKIAAPYPGAGGLDEAQAFVSFENGKGLEIRLPNSRFLKGRVEDTEQKALKRLLEGFALGLGKRMCVWANGQDTHHVWEAIHRALGRSLAWDHAPAAVIPDRKLEWSAGEYPGFTLKSLTLNSAEISRDTGEVRIKAKVALDGKGVKENIGEPMITRMLKEIANGLGAKIEVDYWIKPKVGYDLQHVKTEETFKTIGKALFAMLKNRIAITGAKCMGFDESGDYLVTAVYDGRPLVTHNISTDLLYGGVTLGNGKFDLATLDDGLHGLAQAMGIGLVITSVGRKRADIVTSWAHIYKGSGKALAVMMAPRPYLKDSVAGVQKVEG